MKKAPVILLCIVFAAALVLAFLLYRTYGEKERASALCEKEIIALGGKLSEVERERAAAEVDILEKTHTRISDLEKAMETKSRAYSELEQGLGKLKEEAHEKGGMIEALKQEVAAKERALAETGQKHEAEITALSEDLSVRVRGFSQAKEQLVQELHAVREDVAKEKEALATLEKSLSDLEAAREVCRQSVSRLEKDLASAKGESAEKDKRIEALKENLSARERALDETREKHEKEMVALREELSVRERSLAGAKEQLEKELFALQKEIAGEKEELAKFQKSLSELKGEKESLEHRLARMKSTHTSMLGGLEQEIRNKEITIQRLKEKLSITFVDQVLFESGKTSLTPRGKEIMGKVSGILKTAESRYIRVVGHTDDKPILPEYRYKYPSNWELSAARAAMVVRFFQHDTGLDPANLEVVGRSFYEPVAGNETEEGRALNRRVMIVIGPRID
jgi:chemotaxis protein MotB